MCEKLPGFLKELNLHLHFWTGFLWFSNAPWETFIEAWAERSGSIHKPCKVLEVTLGRLGFPPTVYYLGFRLRGCLLLKADLLNCFFSEEPNKQTQNYKHNPPSPPPPLPRTGDLKQTVRILSQIQLLLFLFKSRVAHSERYGQEVCPRTTPYRSTTHDRSEREEKSRWKTWCRVTLRPCADKRLLFSLEQGCNYITSLRNSAFRKKWEQKKISWESWSH